MPDLPTISVSQAQAQRLLAAFGTVADYRKWLKARLTEHVLTYERSTVEADVAAFHQQKMDEITNLVIEDLTPPPLPPWEMPAPVIIELPPEAPQ